MITKIIYQYSNTTLVKVKLMAMAGQIMADSNTTLVKVK